MSKESIGQVCQNSATISNKLQSVTFNSVRKVLPDTVIEQACCDVGCRYRQRTITPVITVLHMLLAAIWPEESFKASWEVLWCSFKSRFPHLSDKSPWQGSVAKARARLPLELWRHLFEWLSRQAQTFSGQFDKWNGLRVVLLDGMTVSMSDAKSLFDAFGIHKGQYGKSRYPLARIVAVSLANTMMVIDYALGRYDQDENPLAAPLLKKLSKGDILLADRHFAAAHYYVNYMRLGLEFLTRAHQRLRISRIKRVISYGENDFVGRLKVGALYRRRDSTLPATIMVRFIRSQILVRGKLRSVWMVTSLLDNRRYRACEIVKLYASRWRIETLFKEVKNNMSMDVLRSRTPEGIYKEVAARMTAVNVVRTIMLEAAIENGVDPLRISFVHAVRAILNFAPALATQPLWQLPQIYKAMLSEIAAHLVPHRPGRNEPRAIRRDPKHYPRLKTTRQQWRQQNAA